MVAPSAPTGNISPGSGNWLTGGLGTNTNVGAYQTGLPQQQALAGLMGTGVAQVNGDPQAQFRAMQMQQAQQLQGIANGTQQGAGELAAQRQVQNAVAAQQAQARMARGGANSALAARNAANNTASIGLTGAGQAQQAALSDQQAAQGQLSNALNQGRGQDLSMGTTNAQLQQNQYGQNLGALTSLNGQQLGANQASMQATNQQQGILGGLLNMGGAAIGALASDRGLKTSINEDAGSDIDDMLNHLVAKTYRYKDEKYGAGARIGVMAQDMAKSQAGARVVRAEPDGLKLDVNNAIGAALAATARLNHRMRKLEGARG